MPVLWLFSLSPTRRSCFRKSKSMSWSPIRESRPFSSGSVLRSCCNRGYCAMHFSRIWAFRILWTNPKTEISFISIVYFRATPLNTYNRTSTYQTELELLNIQTPWKTSRRQRTISLQDLKTRLPLTYHGNLVLPWGFLICMQVAERIQSGSMYWAL